MVVKYTIVLKSKDGKVEWREKRVESFNWYCDSNSHRYIQNSYNDCVDIEGVEVVVRVDMTYFHHYHRCLSLRFNPSLVIGCPAFWSPSHPYHLDYSHHYSTFWGWVWSFRHVTTLSLVQLTLPIERCLLDPRLVNSLHCN